MIDVHLHLPQVRRRRMDRVLVSMVCAIVSLLTGKCVLPTTAMTGEVSPVGGIKDKVLGAHRAGANRVILP
ncbi:hypothetical protein F5888DRAFT_1696859 [Russula emetica]|nr:hypothetical protein F5888DRAFT_1696859 [Russula emetica]